MIVTREPKAFNGGRIAVTFGTLRECQRFEKTVDSLRSAIERRPKKARAEPVESFLFSSQAHALQAEERVTELKEILGIESIELTGEKGSLKRPIARIVPLPNPEGTAKKNM